jgi:hypothetical protein
VEAASTPEAPSDRIARAVKGPFRNSADFAKELADFEFPLSPAFLYTVHDIGLDACAVHINQVLEKLLRFP